MPPFPETAKTFQVKGPCWVATVEAIELADPTTNLSFRNLFLDTTGRSRLGRDSLYLPGTLLILAAVQQVTITETAFRWERSAAVPSPQTPNQIEAAIQAGTLSLLLVQANPEEWPQQFPEQSNQPFFPELTCLVGEIYLDALTPVANTVADLYSDLQLQPAAALDSRGGDGAAHLLSTLTVHGSGLSIYGRIELPWESVAIAAPFQLTKQITEGSTERPLRLTLERERFTPTEQQRWSAAWNRLSRYLNPLNPQNGASVTSTATTPNWVTLEITDPNAVPNLLWILATWGAERVLNFDPIEINILLSDQPPYSQTTPPTSLGRIVPAWVMLDKPEDTPDPQLRVLVGAGNSVPSNPAASANALSTTSRDNTVEYQFDSLLSPETLFPETFALTGLTIAFDPTGTPQALRQAQELSPPEWSEQTGPIEEPLIWGFMPLEDGWAQLPIPNLTEQIYLDSDVANIDNTNASPTPSPLQGAVSLGNNRRTVLESYPNEQPWNFTLTSLDSIQGQWLLTPDDSGFRLSEVNLLIQQPDVTITGLVWLSRSKPRVEDALPDLDNWVTGVRSQTLRTTNPDALFPALTTFNLENLTLAARSLDTATEITAQLQDWKLLYTVHEPTFNAFTNQQVFKETTFSQDLAWVWQRHPFLPMVQALPLTQNQSPPNYPSASRQLIPFELPVNATGLPDRWSFGVAQDIGATQWPQFLGATAPAREWTQQADLPLVSLSLPGLVLEPAGGLGLSQLTQTYRFDLPYTDELNALAELPTTSPPPDQTSPLPDGILPEPPQPLVRQTFEYHWQGLSQLASLASADAVTAFSVTPSSPSAEIQTLIEPLSWAVEPTVDLTSYPGQLTLTNADSGTNPASGTITADTSPLDISSLEGISGRFSPVNGNGAAPFQITAGSLVAHPENNGLRDQRGLIRAASQQPTPQLLQTPLTFQRTETESSTYALTSLLRPLVLNVGSTAASWQLWFRDVPINTATNRFSQLVEGAEGRSRFAEDINDPEAFSRDQNFLSGYEWRLANAGERSSDFLPLFNLRFYPLTLESVEIDGTEITKIDIVGRLQLPLTDTIELTDLSNAVRLTFAGEPGALRLDNIALVGDENEWPLALQSGEIANAPLLTWTAISLSKDSSGNPIAVAVDGVRLKFFLFDAVWSLPLAAPLEFPTGAPTVVTAAYGFALANDTPLAPESVTISLNLATSIHQVILRLVVRLGQMRAPAIGLRSTAERIPFTAQLSVPLLAVSQSATIPANWDSATLFDDLNLTTDQLILSPTAIQFQWERYTPRESTFSPQFLAGMALTEESPGFAALTFEAIAADAAPDTALFPTLQLKTAVVELLLTCQWGEFLQTATGTEAANNLADQVLKSSAGSLVIGYTTQWQTDSWQESFLLNGFLEVTNLISWPQDLTYSSTENILRFPVLPAVGTTVLLNHRRHTIRILFNQHQIPNELLTVAQGEILFQFAPAQAWQLLAVVEHQLIDIQSSWTQRPFSNDRRWTTVQEVRLTTPQRFRQFLETLETGNTIDPVIGIATLGDANQGYLSTQLRSLLLNELDVLPTNTLLVEASAPHWINQSPVTTTSATTLQFLPNGNQLGILSNPQDYGPSDPRSPQWLLLTMPFLGRLQNAADDSAPSPLQGDPIRLLTRADAPSPLALALTHWVKDAPREILVSSLDTASGRTWARLDPLALEESWFRLQNPLAETSAALQSVLAALPNTPARLSRSTALRYAFNPVRPNSPPAAPGQPQQAIMPDQPLVWRQDSLLATPDSFTDGLQALYTFEEGSGNQINDVSGVSDSPIHLQIVTDTDSQAITEWIPGGGLRVKALTLIRSIQPATRLTQACQSTNEITIAMWVRPAGDAGQPLPQDGPARIVSLSKGSGDRNITLAQDFSSRPDNNSYLARLRTTETNDNGLLPGDRPVITLDGVIPDRVPIFFTRKADGTTRLFTTDANGTVVETETAVGGTFIDWDDTYHLLLANEQKGDRNNIQIDDRRGWLGEYHQVAIYNRALSPTEVRRHIQQGQSRSISLQQPQGWYLTGVQLLSSSLLNTNASALQHYVAATLIPARLMVDSQPNEMPLSLAVSPYLGMDFRTTSAQVSLSLVSTELLCLDRTTGTLLPVASRLEELPSGENPPTENDIQTLRDRTFIWARETHQRLAPESAIAILRFREINRALQSSTEAAITVAYSFAIVNDLQQPQALCQRVFRLRTSPQQMRFREGQFGGYQLPAPRSFELAPPQVTGVQPVYLPERPPELSIAEPPITWPWGLSALRLSVQYTQDRQGIIGAMNSADRWWQAPYYPLQFRSAAQTDKPTAGLPANFRAAAIRSLLPVLPDLPLPTENNGDSNPSDPLKQWQPVLPGSFNYLLTGSRPGVPFALRHQLITQTATVAVVSGSIPIQHRTPRPVSLPPNTAAETALQTWASYFQIDQSSLVSDQPADTAFFAECGPHSAQGLQMILQEPQNRAVTPNWNGDLIFALSTAPEQTDWDIQLELTDGTSTFTYQRDSDTSRFVLIPPPPPVPPAPPAPTLSDVLSSQALGDVINVIAKVKPIREDNGDNFRQTLVFPLRITDETTLPLPLRPQFIVFEDPEYNRLLISNAAHATGNVPVGKESNKQLHAVTISTDRREYNPNSLLFLRFDWDDGRKTSETLELLRVSSTGAVTQLTLPGPSDPADPVTTLPIDSDRLEQLSLSEIQQLNKLELIEGDSLQFKLTVEEIAEEDELFIEAVEIFLSVAIISAPVIPVTQAAYGLLRHYQGDTPHVECVRFAWSPEPTRIELICPKDLQTEVVRRRAVFHWTDSIRPEGQLTQPSERVNSTISYEIQKITQTGSTSRLETRSQ